MSVLIVCRTHFTAIDDYSESKTPTHNDWKMTRKQEIHIRYAFDGCGVLLTSQMLSREFGFRVIDI